jgi:hypothetical protein
MSLKNIIETIKKTPPNWQQRPQPAQRLPVNPLAKTLAEAQKKEKQR